MASPVRVTASTRRGRRIIWRHGDRRFEALELNERGDVTSAAMANRQRSAADPREQAGLQGDGPEFDVTVETLFERGDHRRPQPALGAWARRQAKGGEDGERHTHADEDTGADPGA